MNSLIKKSRAMHTTMQYRHYLTIFFIGLLAACSAETKTADLSQERLDLLAKNMQLKVAIDNNINVENCPAQDGDQCHLAHFELTFPIKLTDNSWRIYFSQTSPIQWEGSDDFDIKHINGDLHVIIPLEHPIEAGRTYVIPFKGANWRVAESDFMPNYFITAGDLQPRIIDATREVQAEGRQLAKLSHVKTPDSEQQLKRNAKDHTPLATAAFLYEKNAEINTEQPSADEQANRIIPKMLETNWQTQRLDISQGLALGETEQVRFAPALSLLQQRGVAFSQQGIALKLRKVAEQELEQEGYRLLIGPQSITVSANDDSGLFYGLISLGQLLEPTTKSLPIGQARDNPLYSFRGLHLDIARNFHSKAFVLKMIEQMASYKINKLHLHMADDEGWRLEIPGLPELTDIGGFRCFDLSEQQCLQPQLGSGPDRDTAVNGYLSTTDYIEILKFAKQRQIEVIPALDMPGHSRAAVKAMLARYHSFKKKEDSGKAEQYLLTELADNSQYSSVQYYNDNTLNPCIPSTYVFIEKIIDEVSKLHDQAGVPLKRYHIGADETAGAWRDSPACQQLIEQNNELDNSEQLTAYFVAKVAHMVSVKGLIPGAWSDGLSHVDPAKLPANIQANIWDTLYWQGHNRAHEFANRNWDTVLSLPDVLYFDFPYQNDPLEPGYYWGSRYTDSFQVFQFMPENLPAMAQLWDDRMGDAYTSEDTSPLLENSNLIGIQAQLWSETVRSDEAAEYMLFPRLLVFAERAWHKASWAVPYQAGKSYSQKSEDFTAAMKTQQLQDWAGFSHNLVNSAMPDLLTAQVTFRLPTPGAMVKEGKLMANNYFPGLNIQFREAGQDWQNYQQSVAIKGPIELRTSLSGTSLYSRIVKINP
jgi:hexosaminidase